MSNTKVIDRQYPLVAVKKLTKANLGAGKGYDFVVPMNALVTEIVVITTTAFDSATTATATVSDGTTTFANAVDIKTVGSETVANTPKFYPTGGTISANLAETGATATVGEVVVLVRYVILERGQEIQA